MNSQVSETLRQARTASHREQFCLRLSKAVTDPIPCVPLLGSYEVPSDAVEIVSKAGTGEPTYVWRLTEHPPVDMGEDPYCDGDRGDSRYAVEPREVRP